MMPGRCRHVGPSAGTVRAECTAVRCLPPSAPSDPASKTRKGRPSPHPSCGRFRQAAHAAPVPQAATGRRHARHAAGLSQAGAVSRPAFGVVVVASERCSLERPGISERGGRAGIGQLKKELRHNTYVQSVLHPTMPWARNSGINTSMQQF